MRRGGGIDALGACYLALETSDTSGDLEISRSGLGGTCRWRSRHSMLKRGSLEVKMGQTLELIVSMSFAPAKRQEQSRH